MFFRRNGAMIKRGDKAKIIESYKNNVKNKIFIKFGIGLFLAIAAIASFSVLFFDKIQEMLFAQDGLIYVSQSQMTSMNGIFTLIALVLFGIILFLVTRSKKSKLVF